VPKRILLLVAALALAGTSVAFTPSSGQREFNWQLTPTGSTARLRGLSAVSASVAWASGAGPNGSAVLRTVDAGATWLNFAPPGTDDLLFRDVEAFDADTAVILAIGPGDASRVYRTTNGGQSWTLTFLNDDPNAFYDCMAFFDQDRGLALSDPSTASSASSRRATAAGAGACSTRTCRLPSPTSSPLQPAASASQP
jgi:photosystem II stability/assembly factor-like uncharacterized protein